MLLCFFRCTRKGTFDNGYFYLLPDAPSAFFVVVRCLSRADDLQSLRYRVVEDDSVAELAVHPYRIPRHHESRAFLHFRHVEYHPGDEAVGETGATRVVPDCEAVLVVGDEHVPVLRPVLVMGDAQPVAGVKAEIVAQYPAEVHAAVAAYRDHPLALVGQCRVGVALVVNCQFHRNFFLIGSLYIII
ncbi:hypothetical protein BACCOP_01204 [Phocaeicola coprocola DSM 17136]|uniref:Uncharacterized protein n=1 Tax=Phocaeicola coprocola DSM 17136 TaxID=470145 RepID=B3JH48_9BACT|nr:hypothetical protein BACCOP_01204 [Phocaeicola coprocola DSM 17136]